MTKNPTTATFSQDSQGSHALSTATQEVKSAAIVPAAVLFDLDGTLIDTAADFVRILKVMAAEHDWQLPPETAIREQVSAGAAAMVSLLLRYNQKPISEAQLKQYRQQFLDEYEGNICVDSVVFDGLEPLLEALESAGVAWGIVTNKPRYLAEKLLAKLALAERCQVLVCPQDVKNAKPDPEPMYLAVSQLGLDKADASRVVYVGDHIRDIQAGNAADMVTVLASYGYIPPEDQADLTAWDADYIVATPHELTALLRNEFAVI